MFYKEISADHLIHPQKKLNMTAFATFHNTVELNNKSFLLTALQTKHIQ